MKNSCLAAGITAAVLSVGCATTIQAQVVEPVDASQSQQTVTTTTQTTTMSSYPPPTPMSAPASSAPLTGQVQTVSYDNKFLGIGFGKEVAKTIVMDPGMGQVSLDGLGLRDRVSLTLVNPSATPLQFETTQRWGKQIVTVVPPHSQQVLTFSKSRPFTHEIKFFVMQQPDNAVASNQDYIMQQTAAVAGGQQVIVRETLNQQTAQLQQSQEEAIRQAIAQQAAADQARAAQSETTQYQRQSAVRGYW